MSVRSSGVSAVLIRTEFNLCNHFAALPVLIAQGIRSRHAIRSADARRAHRVGAHVVRRPRSRSHTHPHRLPLDAKWMYQPQMGTQAGSREAQTLDVLRKPRDWA